MFEATRKAVHARLMGRMATTVGADLETARETGRIDAAGQAAALVRCLHCGHVGSCEDWLDEHVDGADRPPSFCANRKLMSSLQS